MNKLQFLTTLQNLLKGIPETDKSDILYDYEEHFRIGMENEKTEEEISASLGDVRAIALQFKADYSINQAETNASAGNILRAVLAAGALGFFNLVFILGPFMGLVGILFGLFAAGIGLTVGGIGGILILIFAPAFPNNINLGGLNPLVVAFTSLGIACFGILFFIGVCYLSKFFYKGTVKYLKWNLDIIRK